MMTVLNDFLPHPADEIVNDVLGKVVNLEEDWQKRVEIYNEIISQLNDVVVDLEACYGS